MGVFLHSVREAKGVVDRGVRGGKPGNLTSTLGAVGKHVGGATWHQRTCHDGAEAGGHRKAEPAPSLGPDATQLGGLMPPAAVLSEHVDTSGAFLVLVCADDDGVAGRGYRRGLVLKDAVAYARRGRTAATLSVNKRPIRNVKEVQTARKEHPFGCRSEQHRRCPGLLPGDQGAAQCCGRRTGG